MENCCSVLHASFMDPQVVSSPAKKIDLATCLHAPFSGYTIPYGLTSDTDRTSETITSETMTYSIIIKHATYILLK